MTLGSQFRVRWVGVMVVFLAASVLMSAVSYFFWQSTHNQHIVAGISLYPTPITLSVNDTELLLEPFADFQFEVETHSDLNVLTHTADNQIIEQYTIPTTSSRTLNIVKLGAAEKYCILKTNSITGAYYGDDSLTSPNISTYSIVSRERQWHQLPLQTPSELTLYPGKYNPNELPLTLPQGQQLTGYYPASCTIQPQQVTELVRWWTGYSPAMQFDLYEEGMEVVRNTPEYL